MVSKNTDALIRRQVVPFLCLSTESPLIARSFYTNIRELAGRFVYNLQFRGTRERLKDTGTLFSPMYYPVDSRTSVELTPWNERKFLVLINRNKRAFFHDRSSVKNIIRSILSRVNVRLQRMRDPWIRSKEIYKDRIDAIYYFSNNPGFALYGEGWEQPIPGFGSRYHEAAIRAHKGPLGPGEKLRTMSKFKFAVCFENCAFPGYVTEKIFDCFLAGCIPVYFGAPDISDFVPENTFIDFRQFENMKALELYLSQLSEEAATKMIEAARKFINSEAFKRHDENAIVKQIVDRAVMYPKTQPFN
jgi:hypothetical protein